MLLVVALFFWGRASHGEVDKGMVQMVTETILSNFDRLKSYEAEYQIESFDTLPMDGKNYPLNQKSTVKVWHDSPKWRNDIKTQILSFADKGSPKTIDAAIVCLFDGEKTIVHQVSGDFGKVSVGDRFGTESTARYIQGVFIAFGIDTREDLHRANSLNFVEAKGKKLLRAHFNFAPDGTIDVYLNPANAFHIEFAEAKDMRGRLKGLHRSTQFLHIPGTPKVTVFCLGMTEEFFDADRNVIKSEKLNGTIKHESINRPCWNDIFVYDFPGGTLVKDEVKGTNRVTPFRYGLPDDAGFKYRLPAIIIFNVLFIFVFFMCRYWMRKRS